MVAYFMKKLSLIETSGQIPHARTCIPKGATWTGSNKMLKF